MFIRCPQLGHWGCIGIMIIEIWNCFLDFLLVKEDTEWWQWSGKEVKIQSDGRWGRVPGSCGEVFTIHILLLHCKTTLLRGPVKKNWPPSTTSPYLGGLRRKKLWFILHVRSQEAFLVFTKMFCQYFDIYILEYGTPSREKFPNNPIFAIFPKIKWPRP